MEKKRRNANANIPSLARQVLHTAEVIWTYDTLQCLSLIDAIYSVSFKRSAFERYLRLQQGRIHEEDLKGNTALHHACFIGNIEAVRLLLEAGADVLKRNKEGKNPIEFCIDQFQGDCLVLIFTHLKDKLHGSLVRQRIIKLVEQHKETELVERLKRIMMNDSS